MANTTISPGLGSIAVTGKATSPLAQGVTFEAATSIRNSGFKVSNKSVTAWAMSHTYTIAELQKNVSTGVGYVPGGVTVIGFVVTSDDLDSGGAALRQSLVLGSTSLVTGIADGANGTSAFYPCVPTDTTAPTVVYQKVTTAATTAATGAVSVTAMYFST